MTTKRPGRRRTGALYRAGEKGRNRVNLVRRRSGLFALEWYQGGRRREVSLGHRDLSRAKLEADRQAAALGDRSPGTAEPVTVGQLFDNYLREVTPSKSKGVQAHDTAVAELVLGVLGAGRKAREVSASEFRRILEVRRARGDRRPGRAHGRPLRTRALQYDGQAIRAVFAWGVRAGHLDRNPIPRDEIPAANQPRRPRLSPEAYRALLAAGDQVGSLAKVLLVMAHETGHRIASICQLRWTDVDLDRLVVHWRAGYDKTGWEHSTPLAQEAAEELRRWRKLNGSVGDLPVFHAPSDPTRPVSRHYARGLWRRLEAAAGLPREPGRGWHSLRRLFADELRDQPLKDITALGGWREPMTVVRVYQGSSEATQRAALDARARRRAEGGP